MDPYVTTDALKATLSLTGETFADGDLEVAVSAASRNIDNLCSRTFAEGDCATSRVYSPEHADQVEIDDLCHLTALHTDPAGDGTFSDAWVLDQDFVLGPVNAQADGRPWTTIIIRRSGRWLPVGSRTVRVTGQFGWPDIPDEIRLATTVLASKLLRRAREAPFGVITLGLEGGAVRVARTDPDVMALIAPYMRHRIAAA